METGWGVAGGRNLWRNPFWMTPASQFVHNRFQFDAQGCKHAQQAKVCGCESEAMSCEKGRRRRLLRARRLVLTCSVGGYRELRWRHVSPEFNQVVRRGFISSRLFQVWRCVSLAAAPGQEEQQGRHACCGELRQPRGAWPHVRQTLPTCSWAARPSGKRLPGVRGWGYSGVRP